MYIVIYNISQISKLYETFNFVRYIIFIYKIKQYITAYFNKYKI